MSVFKFFLCVSILCLNVLNNAIAQSDSIVFVRVQWQKEKIGKGVKLRTFHFKDSSLFNSNENISILEIKPGKRIKIDLGYHEKELIKTSDFGKKNNAVAALNGTFFDVKNGGSVDYIKADNKRINYSRLGKDSLRANHQRSAIVFLNGTIYITKYDGSTSWEDSLVAEDVMVSGPLLRLNNADEMLDTTLFNKTRHPRTMVGILKSGKILLVTVDGRDKNAAGMSMKELQTVMRWLGTESAINLDGGGSTALWVNGQPDGGVVNYPSDNKIWDHLGERKVANVILVKRLK